MSGFFLILLLVILKESNLFLLNLLFSLFGSFGSSSELEQLRKELKEAEESQKKIFIMDEFSKHAKLQRKINSLQENIKKLRSSQGNNRAKWHGYLRMASSALIHLSLMMVLCCYRKSTVLVLEPEFNCGYLASKLMAINLDGPGDGAVGYVFWAICCQLTLNPVVSFLLNRFTSSSAATESTSGFLQSLLKMAT